MCNSEPDMAAVNPKFAQNGDEKGKVFIGGLSWETTTASMLKYFSRYGEVIDCVVMKNQQTGKSRGFGFVKFRDMSCVETVLSSGPHILDGRQIDPKACNPRSMNKVGSDGSAKNTDVKNRNKIFLGGLPSNCTESQIKEVFSQFGKVNDVTIMWDQEKQKPRGFGFLSFEDDESVERVCLQHYITVAGKKVECKRAEPRELKELHALQFGGGIYANGALGMPGMALGPGLISSPYQTFSQHQLAAAQVHVGHVWRAGGGLSMAGGPPSLMGPASSMGEHEPSGWPAQMAAVSAQPNPAYLSAGPPTAAQLGASQTGMGLAEQYMAQQQEQSQVTGYISASPVPGSTTPGPQDEQNAPPQKTPYVLYSNQASQLGILGNYPQEASSYGPARGYGQEGAVHSAIQTPYTASVTYAAAPGLALQQGPYVGALGNGYGGGVPLSFAYGGHGDATSAAYTAALQAAAARSSSMSQGFHPYRR